MRLNSAPNCKIFRQHLSALPHTCELISARLLLYIPAMLIRAYALFILSFSSIMGLAIPLAGPHCNETSYERGFRDLIHKVGVVGVDDRRRTSELVERGDISQEEEDLLKVASGSIHCPVTINGQRGELRSSAAVVNTVMSDRFGTLIAGDHGPSQTLITAAHAFYYPNSNKPLSDLSRCYFLNRAGRRVDLDLSDVDLSSGATHYSTLRLGTNRPVDDERRDRAVVRLKKPITRSIGIESSGVYLLKGQKLINISAPHADMLGPKYREDERIKRYNFKSDLVGQVCSARKVEFFSESNASPSLMTDCSASGHASGSVVLTRGQDDRLIAVGILTSGASHEGWVRFHEDYNNTVVIGMDRIYADEIAAIAKRSRMSTAAVSN